MWVILGLRAITIIATLSWRKLVKTFNMLLAARALKVLAGLLVSSSRGWPITVCVTVICRRRFFESRAGWPPTCVVRLIRLRVVTVCRRCLVPFILVQITGSLIPLCVASRGNRRNRRNIKLTPWP